MAKRKKRRSSKRSLNVRERKGKRHTGPASLVVVDQKPFLKKALTQCRRLRTELHKKQERLRVFEEEEMSAYQRWFNSEFGGLLTEIREMRNRFASLELIYEELDYCMLVHPGKLREVHAELKKRLEEGTLHAYEAPWSNSGQWDDDEFDDDEDDDEFDDDEEAWEAFEEAEREFRKMFERGFRDGPDATEDEREPGGGDRRRSGARSRTREDAGVKSLYRTLAKRLHPDHSDLESHIRERRWNELQLAYEERDLEKLRRIEAVCDMDSGGLSISMDLARLRDLAAYHRSHVEPVRRALREAKRHPAFDFETADREKMRGEAGNELAATRAQLREGIDMLMREIDEFAKLDPPAKDGPVVRWTGTFGKPVGEKRSDKDIWDSHDAWREEELRRSAAESSGKTEARKTRSRKR